MKVRVANTTDTIQKEPTPFKHMTLKKFKADLGTLRFSPDGTTLAAGRASFIARQRTVQLWRAPSFPEIEAAEAKEKAEIKQP